MGSSPRTAQRDDGQGSNPSPPLIDPPLAHGQHKQHLAHAGSGQPFTRVQQRSEVVRAGRASEG